MNKRIVLMLLVLVNLLLFSSCDEIGDGGSRVVQLRNVNK